MLAYIKRSLFGADSDQQVNKQDQAETFENEETLIGATLATNKHKVLKLLNGVNSRLLTPGNVGENAFHMCFLFPDESKLAFAKWLLTLCPELITTVFTDTINPVTGETEKGLYAGENVLHMAIANHLPISTIEWLIRTAPSLVHGRADGDFFRPGKDGFAQPDEKVRCAWGESPLSFAVSVNRPDVVRLLVERGGANMLQGDTDGNTALHLAVMYKRKPMIELLDALWENIQSRRLLQKQRREQNLPPIAQNIENASSDSNGLLAPLFEYDEAVVPLQLMLSQVVNIDGHTPMVLAAKLGDGDMFSHLWSRSRKISWSYWHVTSYTYPLEHVDDIWDIICDKTSTKQTGSADRKKARTALQLLTDEDFEDVVLISKEVTVLRELLEQKWKTYANSIFQRRFVMVVCYLMIFAATIVIRGKPTFHAKIEEVIGDSSSSSSSSLFSVFDRTLFPWVTALGTGRFKVCSSALCPGVEPWVWWSDLTGFEPTSTAPLLCILGVLGEFIVVLGAIVKLYASFKEMGRVGIKYYFKGRGAARLERALSFLFSFSIFGTIWAERIGDQELGRNLLSVSSIVGNFYILWFLLGWRLTGPFVVMLWKMFTSDLARFLSIAIVLLIGFSQAFFVQLGQQGPTLFVRSLMVGFDSMVAGTAPHVESQPSSVIPDGVNEAEWPRGFALPLAGGDAAGEMHGTGTTSNTTTGSAFGMDETIDVTAALPRSALYALSLAYVLLGNVVLLNLLVAMMGDTYTNVSVKAASQWFLERARIILQIEASMSLEERMKHKYYGVDKNGKPFLQSEVEDPVKFRADQQDPIVDETTTTVKNNSEHMKAIYAVKIPRTASEAAFTDGAHDDDDDDDDEATASASYAAASRSTTAITTKKRGASRGRGPAVSDEQENESNVTTSMRNRRGKSAAGKGKEK